MMPFRASANDHYIGLRDGKEKDGQRDWYEGAEFVKQRSDSTSTTALRLPTMQRHSPCSWMKVSNAIISATGKSRQCRKHIRSGKIDYFYLPTVDEAKTQANEFCVNSGIGMAFNVETLMRRRKISFCMSSITTETICRKTADVSNQGRTFRRRDYSDLYLRDSGRYAEHRRELPEALDMYLDSDDTNTIMQDNQLLLASGGLLLWMNSGANR